MNRWGRDFESLFAPLECSPEQQQCINDIKAKNIEKEERLRHTPNQVYNDDITEDEVSKTVFKAKNNKAPGLDSLTYEVLKNDVSVTALTKLSNFCLNSGIVPEIWTIGLINPIPESANSDPWVPLNDRGISLLPVVGKIYMLESWLAGLETFWNRMIY